MYWRSASGRNLPVICRSPCFTSNMNEYTSWQPKGISIIELTAIAHFKKRILIRLKSGVCDWFLWFEINHIFKRWHFKFKTLTICLSHFIRFLSWTVVVVIFNWWDGLALSRSHVFLHFPDRPSSTVACAMQAIWQDVFSSLAFPSFYFSLIH